MSIFKKKMILGTGLFAGLIAAIGAVMVYKNGMGEAAAASNNETIFQGFEWNISSDGTHWENLAENADELSQLGISSMWLPPAYKASNVADAGYSAYDLYDLGEFNQKGSVRTKYGTKDQYISLIDTLHTNNIKAYADIVLNHKSSADSKEVVSAIKVNSNDRNVDLSEAQDIEAWTIFNYEGRNNTYSSFKWNSNHFDGVDWDQLSSTSAVFRFADKTWDSNVSTENGNYDYLMSADVDLENQEVIDELNTWAKWYVETANLDGFRLDAVKHMSSTFYKNWLRTIRANTGKDLYAVAENYDYDVDDLYNYIKKINYSATVFDFPLQGNFKAASDGNYDMSKLFDNTLTKKASSMAVPFVENHDTQAAQNSNYIKQWFKGIAYASILTRNIGTPCVFYGDYYGTGDGKNQAITDELNVLLSVRKICAYGKERTYFNDEDVIGWTREGNYYHKYYGLATVISDGTAGSKTMNVGTRHKNETWVDITGNCTDTVKINNKGNGTFPVNEKSYSIWVSNKAAADIRSNIESANEKAQYTVPEDNTAIIYYNTTWNSAYLHYQIGSGEWTTSPGEKLTNTNLSDYKVITVDLGTDKYLTGCFNDGGSDWDSNNGSNYKIKAGIYTISSGVINIGTPDGYDSDADIIEEVSEEPKEEKILDSTLSLIYYSTWDTPYAHYCVGSGAWTTSPGTALSSTDKDSFYSIDIPMNSDDTVTLCFNDGDSNWDSYDGDNYKLTSGSYIIYNKRIFKATFDDIDSIFGTADDKTATIYYYAPTDLTAPIYAHYGIDNNWTTAPGEEMTLVEGTDNKYYITIDLGSSLSASMCFNDGTNWDSNNGLNYVITTGTCEIQDGVIFTIPE